MFQVLYPTLRSIFYDMSAAVIWGYAIVKLFVFDVDQWLVRLISAEWAWLLNLRFIVIVAVLLVAALAMGRKGFLRFIGYAVGFPIIFLFWRLPRAVVLSRSWTTGLVILNVLLSVAVDVLYRMVYFIIYATCIALAVVATWDALLYVALVGLGLCVVSSYIKSCVDAFRSPRVLSFYTSVFNKIAESGLRNENAPPVLGLRLPSIPEDELVKYVNYLQPRVAIGQVANAFSRHLRVYNDSEIHVIGGMLVIAKLIILTLITFAIMYYVAVRIEPLSLTISSSTFSAFDYVYISFDNMFFNMNSSAQLATIHTQFLSMLQRFLSATLVVILLTTLLDIRKKKHTREIEAAIEAAGRTAQRASESIKSEFSYEALAEAADDLKNVKSSLYSTISGFFERKALPPSESDAKKAV